MPATAPRWMLEEQGAAQPTSLDLPTRINCLGRYIQARATHGPGYYAIFASMIQDTCVSAGARVRPFFPFLLLPLFSSPLFSSLDLLYVFSSSSSGYSAASYSLWAPSSLFDPCEHGPSPSCRDSSLLSMSLPRLFPLLLLFLYFLSQFSPLPRLVRFLSLPPSQSRRGIRFSVVHGDACASYSPLRRILLLRRIIHLGETQGYRYAAFNDRRLIEGTRFYSPLLCAFIL